MQQRRANFDTRGGGRYRRYATRIEVDADAQTGFFPLSQLDEGVPDNSLFRPGDRQDVQPGDERVKVTV